MRYIRPGAVAFIGVLMAALVLLWHISFYLIPVDDAFIAFRYAENFSNGSGLVFNEGERVEGYTDFLWVILLALFHKAGFSTLRVSQVLGVIYALSVLPVIYIAGRRIMSLNLWAALLPCLLVSSSASVAMWAGGGLETPLYMALFTFSLTLMLIELQKDPKVPLSGILFGLTTLTRPEGAGMFVACCALAILFRAGRMRTIWFLAAGFALVVLPHVLFRFIYYGDLVPNTFHAKTGLNAIILLQGFQYTADFFLTHGIWGLLFIIPLPFMVERRDRPFVLIPMLVLLLAVLYITSVGGDFYVYSRFYVPYWPWLILLAIAAAWRTGEFMVRKGHTLQKLLPTALSVVVSVSVAVPAKHWVDLKHRGNLAGMERSAKTRKEYGLWLRRNFPPDTLIATSALGQIPYYSNLPTVDMLGLVDRHIARTKVNIDRTNWVIGHLKYDSEYVLSRKPDLLVIEYYLPDPKGKPIRLYTEKIYQVLSPEKGWWKAPYDLIGKKEFRLNYVPRLAPLPSGIQYIYFQRDSGLLDLQASVSSGAATSENYYNLSLQYRMQGLYDEFDESLRMAIRLDPDSRNAGFFLIELDRYYEAYETFMKMRESFPHDIYVSYGIALSLFHMKQYRSSIMYWEEYLQEAPPGDPYIEKARGFLKDAYANAQ